MSSYQDYEKAERKVISENREVVFDAHQELGVTSVTVVYEGSGDSGGIEDFSILPADCSVEKEVVVQDLVWGNNTPEKKTVQIKEVIENTSMGIVAIDHGGWENNEGGGGEVTWDVETRVITLEHYDYFVERNYSTSLY
ncbi:hypothetical protein CFR75_12260 [Komagataeibacter xylinus]|uniref:DUF6878 domain-containing protein n=1 Tax=Komagataeibacter xylinus TaxID=28448 RepID=A0A318PGS8_KOMXY|nr:DUF6878 family protein [Komagataeibacter xylinus]PYD56194.1 hypothetical protein CFR75_12260 [Komagataeibacter xylinus]GBQ67980.1 hypothetical protein AA15237_0287 [Komagataeibacter xylinus NBRC 15237]